MYVAQERGAKIINNIKDLLSHNYNIGTISEIKQLSNGIGSNSYFINANSGHYIFKDIEANHMNYPENEQMILEALASDGLPVPRLIANNMGEYVLTVKLNKYHLQTFLEGSITPYNSQSEKNLCSVGEMLGKIQCSLSKLALLPTGIGKKYFDYFTEDSALASHEETISLATEKGDQEIVDILQHKITLIKKYHGLNFDFSRITQQNTHGDYTTNQVLFSTSGIVGVIDFTSACVHPLCWELLRAFLHGEPTVLSGIFNEEKWLKYVDAYSRYTSLTQYDYDIALPLYIYQNLLAEYFIGYYQTKYHNKHILYDNAVRNHQHTLVLDSFLAQK